MFGIIEWSVGDIQLNRGEPYVECNCKADETRAQELEPTRGNPPSKDSSEKMQWKTV